MAFDVAASVAIFELKDMVIHVFLVLDETSAPHVLSIILFLSSVDSRGEKVVSLFQARDLFFDSLIDFSVAHAIKLVCNMAVSTEHVIFKYF